MTLGLLRTGIDVDDVRDALEGEVRDTDERQQSVPVLLPNQDAGRNLNDASTSRLKTTPAHSQSGRARPAGRMASPTA